MFSKVLIAGRGEIAVRVIRACKEMGILTVAVFSEADRNSLQVNLADEGICIGPPAVKDSYLNMTAILSAAINTGAQAIHPGYGLLSENARFAALAEQCGLTFIGPTSDMIARMGDKSQARRLMAASGLPIIPGTETLTDISEALEAAKTIGYPLLIKAKAGGGGRGIKLVKDESQLEKAFAAAKAEAEAYFGDSGVYIEKYLHPVNHVEMQILCDMHGNAVCLGERECSIQRKNQKLLEESPSMAIKNETRLALMKLCVNTAKKIGYTGLGTMEFLADADGHCYFMEMNTRLQVEHPVTEMMTGIDLVKWQLRAAAGQPLNFTQKDIKPKGCAMECRINAENPAQGFRPASGRITLLHIPGGPHVRFDTAVYQDYDVPPYYDSLLGKLIVHAGTREEAIRKMKAALCELVIEGVQHNADMHLDILSDDLFVTGGYHTDYMEQRGY